MSNIAARRHAAGRLIWVPLCFAQEEDGYTGLHHAAKLGSLEIVTMLLETGQVDVNAQVRPESAGERRRTAQLSRNSLVRAGRFQDSGGWTPIIWAAEHKHVQVIRALLNRGADVTIVDKVRFSKVYRPSKRRQENLQRTHTNTGTTCKLHTQRPQAGSRTHGFLAVRRRC